MPPRPLLLPLLLLTLPAHAADTRLVRETGPLSPEEERQKLTVPEGFEIQLFASEPMIHKPINMAFDAKGRLWVSSTTEYPYSADKSRWSDARGTRVKDSRDAIKILEDTDGDGRADKVTDFADGLNIPTGIVPWHKPEHQAGCIAWSIPNIWYFADTDGDGTADLREVIFGPLGYEKDTHGMCSSFRLGLDGWIYATHGFNNTSHFKTKDGAELELHSGNVFRFRPDGSAVEAWTRGQVNPFGLAWDRYGNLYSADCHSSPVYQLIRGAHYPSFGKPHDGLGFAPVMCQHTHGSTGICGIVYLDGGVWGPEWDDHVFLGNVVTSRVNLDKVTFTGSTPKANERPDFVTSADPWFRPVDLQLGPDNALYIADFYNRIIGHYEVPLDHPGRDRERGRIWRVVKKGRSGSLKDWASMTSTSEGMKTILDKASPHQKKLAVDWFASSPAAWLQESFVMCPVGEPAPTQESVEYRAWAALRTSSVSGASSLEASATDIVSEKHMHLKPLALRLLAALDSWNTRTKDAVTQMAYDCPTSQFTTLRALADAAKAHPTHELVIPLLGHLHHCPSEDLSLRHTLKLAIRSCLETPKGFRELTDSVITPNIRNDMFDVISSTRTTEAARFLLERLPSMADADQIQRAISHISRQGAADDLPKLIEVAKAKTGNALNHLQALADGLSERGMSAPAELLAWARELAEERLADAEAHPEASWLPVPQPEPAPVWSLRARPCADGVEARVLQSMGQGGGAEESRTGALKSRAFPAPEKLVLWINGHRGPPSAEAHEKNLVRVVETATGTTLARAFPPRHDTAQRTELDLAAHAGKAVHLELVDGDAGKAYAWLGITRIEPPVVRVDDFEAGSRRRDTLQKLAIMLRHSAPVALRDRLAPYLPPSPAPPPLPVSPEQRRQLDALITARSTAFAKAAPDKARGAQIFQTHCAACHQTGGQGGLIGPQLDGIGTRGVERLCEDILDPNRNVDAHFHLHILTLQDGSTLSGFMKAEAGQVLILADAAGREQRVSKSTVVKDDVQPLSLMPPVFGQTLPEKDFTDLLGWLLER